LPHSGALVVTRCKCTFLFLLVTACIFTLVVPIADQPETAFNEIDTPINQTTPVAPWVKFAPPTVVSIILPKSFNPVGDGIRRSVESIALPTHWHLSPLRDLLCALLI
jgi:hypothetical protein